MAATSKDGDSSTRKWLAMGLVALSVLGIVVVSGVAILSAEDSARGDMSQLVFSSVLPLLGTWVGTVLAFYFARDNLQAATESTLALTGRAETGTPVTDVMIPESDWITYDLGANERPEDIKLLDLHTKMGAIEPTGSPIAGTGCERGGALRDPRLDIHRLRRVGGGDDRRRDQDAW